MSANDLKPLNRRVAAKARKADSGAVVPAAAPPSVATSRGRVVAVLRALGGVLAVVGVAGVVAWGARRYVTTSPRFAVQQIVVRGARLRAPAELAAEAGLAPGENVFLLDLDRAQRRLAADPWLARATLSRRLPGTVHVDVEERQAAALVAAGDTFLATAAGEVFKKLEPGDPDDLPVVTGVERAAIDGDPEGVARTVRRALDVAGDFESSPLAAHGRLEEVHVSTTGLSVVIGKGGLEIVLGNPPYRRKLEQASRALAELGKRGGKPEVLLLDDDARPDRVIARGTWPAAEAKRGR